MKRFFEIARIAVLLSPLFLLTSHAKEASVGDKAPEFALEDALGRKHALADYKGKYVILEWVNHGCPFVQKHYNSSNMQTLQKDMKAKGAVWLSIASSAKGKQGYYTPQQWAQVLEDKKSEPSALLLDYNGKVGKAYGAKTTPHMYIVDPQGVLIYKGAIDDKPTTELEDVPGAKNYVRQAIDEAMAGKKVSVNSTSPYGCSVKYK